MVDDKGPRVECPNQAIGVSVSQVLRKGWTHRWHPVTAQVRRAGWSVDRSYVSADAQVVFRVLHCCAGRLTTFS